jgi:hypothetical protein
MDSLLGPAREAGHSDRKWSVLASKYCTNYLQKGRTAPPTWQPDGLTQSFLGTAARQTRIFSALARASSTPARSTGYRCRTDGQQTCYRRSRQPHGRSVNGTPPRYNFRTQPRPPKQTLQRRLRRRQEDSVSTTQTSESMDLQTGARNAPMCSGTAKPNKEYNTTNVAAQESSARSSRPTRASYDSKRIDRAKTDTSPNTSNAATLHRLQFLTFRGGKVVT